MRSLAHFTLLSLLSAFASAVPAPSPADASLAARQTTPLEIIVRVYTDTNRVDNDGTTDGYPLRIPVPRTQGEPIPELILPVFLNDTIFSVGQVPGPYTCFFYSHISDDHMTCVDPPENGIDCVDYRGK